MPGTAEHTEARGHWQGLLGPKHVGMGVTLGLAHARQELSQELSASLALNFTKLSLVPDLNLFRNEPYF